MENLTNSQKSVWVTEQYYKGSSINNICGSAIIKEQIDFEKLKKAVEIVCQKHDNFRLQLKIESGEVKQIISDEKKTNIDTIVVATPNELEKETKKIVRKPFKLENSELYKFYIFKFEDGEGGFMLNIHHLIADAWTLAFICNEIIKTYSDLKQNKEIETKAIYSYIDYIKAEQEYLESEKYKKDKEYWEEQFKTIPEVATIPGSKPNADESRPEGERKQFNLDAVEVEKIKQYCKENKISLYNFFMAIYAIYIGEISNLDEFVIGTPILNRTNFKEKSAAGMFVNMAPFKINIKQEEDFRTFIKKIALDSMGMLKHQKYSYQCLLENLRDKNKNIPTLYKILLSYQITNAHQNGGDMEYRTEWTFNGCCAENMDIQIYDLNDTGSLNIAYDYKTSIYEKQDIENLHKRIMNIINQVVAKENIELKNIDIVTPEEKEKLVTEFNRTELEYNSKETVISLFEKQAEKTPDKIAIVSNKQKLTYKELNEKANMLAREMMEKGVKQKDIVGIMLNRSPEMIIGLIAILKCGATYLPIDPEYPAERISYMLENSETKLVLINNNTEKYVPENCSKINVKNIKNENKENLNLKIEENPLVYLIYTSGSTGKPKGVQITNRNLNNFIKGMKKEIDFNPNKTMVSVTTICFDIFGLEMWCSLTSGLTLVVANELEQNMPALLNRLCLENKVNMIQTTPSRYSVIFEDEKNLQFLENVTEILVGGEAVNEKVVSNMRKYSKARIFNVYGPTETTIWSTIKELTKENTITVGKPIANTQCYILNKNHKLLPLNIPGELYIGGDGVSNGYLKRDDLNKEKFIESPFNKNSKIYNTNDLAYYTENGEIVHLGRTDFQVKIRGFRIELGEIENAIEKNKNINQAVVVKRKLQNGHDALIAYYTTNNANKGLINELKASLSKELPQYMMPQYFVEIEKMPHTPNGKIDRKSLPEPEIQHIEKEIIGPRNELDKELINIITKMLGIQQISMEDTLLDLGGDSLTAITLSTKILSKYNVQINIKDLLLNYTVKDISDYIKENQEKGAAKIKIEKTPKQETYPLSSAQKRIYYNSKMIDDKNLVYNMPGGIMVDEILDQEKVRDIFQTIIKRHEILRTVFVLQDNDVVQKVKENVEFHIPIYNNTEYEINQIVDNFSKPFDLEKAPLLRTELHYIDNKKTLLLVESHHIVMDGTALNNLIIEFERLYNGENLKKIPVQYKDYAVWENKFNESEKITKYEQYWINKFKNAEFSQLNLPYDYKLPANRSYKGNKISNVIDERKFRKIERYAKKIGASPYMLFISAFFILLYKYTGQKEIILGSPIANRDINETKRMIGMFVNNIAVKANINSEISFQEFLNNMKEQILDDLSNQPYPFDMLVKKLGIKGDNSKNPLFDVMFTYQNKEENIVSLDKHEVEIIEINNDIAKFNLSLEIKPKTHTINIEYCTDLFKKQTIERLFEHYMNVIDSIIDNSNVKIREIEIISKEEKNKILYEFNDTKMEYPKDKTVAQLFEEQVEKTPDKIAVVFEDKTLTYKELNEKANQLANYLISKLVTKNDIIAIRLKRSFYLIISIFAVLKSGATYMLIDPTLPIERIKYMIKDSNSKILITTTELDCNTNVECIKIDQFMNLRYPTKNLENIDITDNLCVLYTSGSTGTPKGVVLTKRGFTNLMYAFEKEMRISTYKDILGIATVSFDMFAVELYTALTFGNTLILANEEEQKDIKQLSTLIKKYDVEFLVTTPSRIELLLSDEYKDSLIKIKCMQLGGEKLSATLVDRIRQRTNAKINNGYGPTEITACCTNKCIEDDNITIGKPLGNVQAFIYNSDMNLCPIGIKGEICIAGEGISKGYINNIEKTKENFIINPENVDQILYKTGDIGKFNQKGEIEYFGRKDDQIKIRGLRIELQEIEAKLNNIDEIQQSKVLYMQDSNVPYLVAFVTAKENVNVHKMKTELSKSLPTYMIPRHIIQIEKMPITINGKVDKKALEKKINLGKDVQDDKSYVPPQNQKQKIFCDIWSELLKTKVGIDDDLFDIGADSLLAINFKTQLLSYNIDLPYADIFKYKTIREICNNEKKNKTIKSSLAEYDYTQINRLLQTQDNSETITKEDNNVLLFGGTGFVGMHILNSFIRNTKGNIYCIVRDKDNNNAQNRFQNLVHFYFDNKLDKYLNKRIYVLNGNITKERWGLSISNYEMLRNNIDVVINSAANVKHYGTVEKFKDINNGLLEQTIDFCLKNNKRLIHISSLSISGNTLLEGSISTNEKITQNSFTEKDLYIGQILDNVYSRSKFEGERLILENIAKKGLDAQILRLGNITNRYSDGKFQINYKDNAFANRVKSFIELKEIPDYLLDEYIEFTPVDLCSDAIISILKNKQKNMYIYHIYNNNHVYFSNLIKLLKNLDFNIKVVNEKDFITKIDTILNSKKETSILSGLVNDFDSNKKLSYSSNIKISNEMTNKILKNVGFEWPEIDTDYVKKYFKYFEKINFLTKE